MAFPSTPFILCDACKTRKSRLGSRSSEWGDTPLLKIVPGVGVVFAGGTAVSNASSGMSAGDIAGYLGDYIYTAYPE
jgi:hypothetical protein